MAVGRSEKGGIRGYPWSVQITIRATRSERRSGKKNAVQIEYAIGMETRIITSSTIQKGRGIERLEMEMEMEIEIGSVWCVGRRCRG